MVARKSLNDYCSFTEVRSHEFRVVEVSVIGVKNVPFASWLPNLLAT